MPLLSIVLAMGVHAAECTILEAPRLASEEHGAIVWQLRARLDEVTALGSNAQDDVARQQCLETRRASMEALLDVAERAAMAVEVRKLSIAQAKVTQLHAEALRCMDRRSVPVGETILQISAGSTTASPAPAAPQYLEPDLTDPTSTFSLDVDTGSYTYARSELQRGVLPNPAFVRPEEFINAFDYDYPRPIDGQPMAVQVEATASPWTPDAKLVRIGFQARNVDREREPAHLVFLVDRSGSMDRDDKFPLVQQMLGTLVTQLDERDTVALVTFDASARIELPPTQASERRTILDAIDRLQPGGSTGLQAGLDTAYTLASWTYEPGHTNRVILASDGLANTGITDPSTLVTRIRDHADLGITLTSIGFGYGAYNDPMMECLADKGDGSYHFVHQASEAERLFEAELASTLQVVARDVKAQVWWDPSAVKRHRLVAYDNRVLDDAQFDDDTVDAGDLGALHQVTALYEVWGPTPALSRWGELRVRHKPPGPDAPSQQTRWTFSPVPSSDPARATSDTRLAIAAAALAQHLRGNSVADLDWRELGELIASLEAQRRDADELREIYDLAEQAESLAALQRRQRRRWLAQQLDDDGYSGTSDTDAARQPLFGW